MGEHSVSDKKPEAKVLAATGGSVIGSSAAIIALAGDAPQWLQVVITILGPPVIAFLSGYAARHTPRPIR